MTNIPSRPSAAMSRPMSAGGGLQRVADQVLHMAGKVHAPQNEKDVLTGAFLDFLKSRGVQNPAHLTRPEVSEHYRSFVEDPAYRAARTGRSGLDFVATTLKIVDDGSFAARAKMNMLSGHFLGYLEEQGVTNPQHAGEVEILACYERFRNELCVRALEAIRDGKLETIDEIAEIDIEILQLPYLPPAQDETASDSEPEDSIALETEDSTAPQLGDVRLAGEGQTPLTSVASKGSKEAEALARIVSCARERAEKDSCFSLPAFIDAEDATGFTALTAIASRHSDYQDGIDLLLGAGADPLKPARTTGSALTCLVRNNKIELVLRIAKKADLPLMGRLVHRPGESCTLAYDLVTKMCNIFLRAAERSQREPLACSLMHLVLRDVERVCKDPERSDGEKALVLLKARYAWDYLEEHLPDASFYERLTECPGFGRAVETLVEADLFASCALPRAYPVVGSSGLSEPQLCEVTRLMNCEPLDSRIRAYFIANPTEAGPFLKCIGRVVHEWAECMGLAPHEVELRDGEDGEARPRFLGNCFNLFLARKEVATARGLAQARRNANVPPVNALADANLFSPSLGQLSDLFRKRYITFEEFNSYLAQAVRTVRLPDE